MNGNLIESEMDGRERREKWQDGGYGRVDQERRK